MSVFKKLYKKYRLFKNKSSILFYKGNITIGKNVEFNQPLRLYNEKGSIIIGDNCFFGVDYGGGFRFGEIEIQTRNQDSKIIIGNNVYTNNNLMICCRKFIKIHDNVLIGKDVFITDHSAHGIHPQKRYSVGTAKNVIIRKNVWIGNNVVVLPGTIIGENSVVGANSVVKGIFPENVIIQGNPAIVLQKIKL